MLHAASKEKQPARPGGAKCVGKKKNDPAKKAVTPDWQGSSNSTGSLRKAPAGVSSKGYPPVSRSEVRAAFFSMGCPAARWPVLQRYA